MQDRRKRLALLLTPIATVGYQSDEDRKEKLMKMAVCECAADEAREVATLLFDQSRAAMGIKMIQERLF